MHCSSDDSALSLRGVFDASRRAVQKIMHTLIS